LPTPDNAIYDIADALAVLQKSPFPFELRRPFNAVLPVIHQGCEGPPVRRPHRG
jgi:hypothetical protein